MSESVFCPLSSVLCLRRQVRYNVRLAIITTDQTVGLFIVLEALVFPVDLQPRPERHRLGVNIDFVGRKVLQQPVKHVVEDRDVPNLATHLFLRDLLAETIRDVAGMANSSGEVAFEDLGVESFPSAAADHLNEIDKMIAAATERLDLFALVVPRDTRIETH